MFQTYPAGLCSAKRFIWTFEEPNIFAHPTDHLQQPVKIQILRCFCAIWLADQSFISQPAPLQETQNRFCPPGILSIFLQMHFTCWVFTKLYWALTWRMFQHLLSIQRQEDWTDMKENDFSFLWLISKWIFGSAATNLGSLSEGLGGRATVNPSKRMKISGGQDKRDPTQLVSVQSIQCASNWQLKVLVCLVSGW